MIQDILIPGNYKGEATYSPTQKFKNGIHTLNNLRISLMKDESSIKMKNKLKAYDQKTNKFLYEAHRDIILTVNKSKKTPILYESKSYIDDEIVSCQFGIVKKMTSNLIEIDILYSHWYITNGSYKNSKLTFKKNKNNELSWVYIHDVLDNSKETKDIILDEVYVPLS